MKPEQLCPNPECDNEIHWHDEKCDVCKLQLLPPNQRLVLAEREALEQSYQLAKAKAERLGCDDRFTEMEQQVAAYSHAVINFDELTLRFLLRGFATAGLSNYQMMIESEMRKPADFENDTERRTVDSALWGSFDKKIRFAALSLNHQGLTSYGCCSATFKDITMDGTATVLIENSYDFARRHEIKTRDCKLPVGYRAVWSQRHKLVMTKMVDKLIEQDDCTDYAELLLFSELDRSTDQFVEVHIYGGLPLKAINVIVVPNNPQDDVQKVDFQQIKELADAAKGKIEVLGAFVKMPPKESKQ